MNLKMLIALMRTVQSIRKKESGHFRCSGLTTAQFGVLEALYHKGDLRVCQIVEKTLSTGGNMTVVINNLVKDGLVSRYKDPEDKRIHMIQLTQKGHDLIASIFPEHVEGIREIFQNLNIEEKQKIIELLKKLNDV